MTAPVLRLSRTAGLHPAALVLLLAAGACDLATGVALVAAPGLVLAPLGIAAPEAGTVYLRLVGAFVAGVGAAYLYPWLPGLARRPGRLATVAEVTALLRGGVALFVTAAVVLRALAAPWSVVAAVDGLLAGAQVLMLRRGWIGHDV